MERDVALRLDGLAWGALGHLDCIAYHVTANLPPDEARRYKLWIGEAMGALTELTRALYAEHPDVTPKELRPASA